MDGRNSQEQRCHRPADQWRAVKAMTSRAVVIAPIRVCSFGSVRTISAAAFFAVGFSA